ncbi:MAG: FtsX-like permease family protein, partial [Ginsengibacter sp.]
VYQIPQASDVKPDVLLSFKTLETPANRDGNDWADPGTTDNGFTSIYLQLRKDANATLVSKGVTDFVRSINPASKTDVVYLQPFSEMHLAPSFNYPYQTYGNLLLVTVFAGIALLIIFIAWLNYINLSTAQALNRAKEVGVKKVLGASRSHLMFQHLTETFLLTVTSVVIAIVLVNILQPGVNQFTGEQLSLSVLKNGWFLFAGIGTIILGSFLSGGYVAFVLTSFKPISTIRSKGEVRLKSFSLRKALVVFQFAASIVFIIATVVLYNQLQYMRNENLGMNLSQLLVVQGPTIASENQAEKNVSFKNGLGQLPFIKKYAASNNVPGVGYNFFANGIGKLNATEVDKKKSFAMFICDQNFFDTYGITFTQGQTFSTNDAERSWNNVKKVIVNEKAAQQMGFDMKENLVGKKINWGTDYEIIGVVKDYHHKSLREAIQPTIYLGSVGYSFFTMQTDTRNIQSKISTIKNLYSKTFPGNPFEYFFADEKYNEQYLAEQQLGKVFIASASVAIFIACLGLFGLSAFSAKQRIKEIGIRKVLGASVAGITSLLSKDFIRLVLIAFIIASPLAWWAMNKWLQNFAYKMDISIWIFILSGGIAIVVALITISFQAIKAAMANPVKSLRAE